MLSRDFFFQIVFYRCHRCGHVGMLGSYGKYGYCGSRWCGRSMYLRSVRITKKEYKRVWG